MMKWRQRRFWWAQSWRSLGIVKARLKFKSIIRDISWIVLGTGRFSTSTKSRLIGTESIIFFNNRTGKSTGGTFPSLQNRFRFWSHWSLRCWRKLFRHYGNRIEFFSSGWLLIAEQDFVQIERTGELAAKTNPLIWLFLMHTTRIWLGNWFHGWLRTGFDKRFQSALDFRERKRKSDEYPGRFTRIWGGEFFSHQNFFSRISKIT